MRIFLVAAIGVAFLAIIFALQNSILVSIAFGVWRITASLALVLLMTLGLGLISGLFVSMPAIIRRNLKIAKYKRQVTELEQDLEEVNRELAHHQQLLAQAHGDIAEQQAQLDRRSLSIREPNLLPDQTPQKRLPEADDIETAELIEDEDTEDWL